MRIPRGLLRSYKAVRNAGFVMLGAVGFLFSFVMAKVFGIDTFTSLGGNEASADVPTYAQSSYGGYSQSAYGDVGNDCCSGGGDSCGG